LPMDTPQQLPASLDKYARVAFLVFVSGVICGIVGLIFPQNTFQITRVPRRNQKISTANTKVQITWFDGVQGDSEFQGCLFSAHGMFLSFLLPTSRCRSISNPSDFVICRSRRHKRPTTSRPPNGNRLVYFDDERIWLQRAVPTTLQKNVPSLGSACSRSPDIAAGRLADSCHAANESAAAGLR